jgi:hypothetical protein
MCVHVASVGRALFGCWLVLMVTGCAPSRNAPVVTPGSGSVDAATVSSGVWTGAWVRQDCDEKGGAVGLACKNIPARQQLQLRLTEEGDRVRGQLELGTLRTDVSGSVSSNGTLRLTGRASSEEQTLELREWQSTIRDRSMEGTFVLTITPAKDELGVVTLTARLDGVTRGSAPAGR